MEGEPPTQASTPTVAVFLSYASQDAEAAQRICDALRAAGIEVWFDQSELRGGDAWDRKIREQIHDCRLFIPVVSANTERRDEGYFRREWALAADRTRDMAHKRTFLVPVVIDGTSERGASVPEKFHELQWTRLPGGETSPAFVEQVRRLLLPEVASARTAATPTPPTSTTWQKSTRSVPQSWRSKLALWATGTVVVLALAYFVAYTFLVLKRSTSAAAPAAPTVQTATITGTAGVFNPPAHSIAVLAFTNLSGDPKQEYFSDGISEELINALSQVNTLRVTARTSSFFFKGKDVDLETIAHKLNVGTILEGSIRRDGNNVRITAELINAATGFHIWSQKYDRELKNILALQSEIAETVTQQLRIPLLGAAAIRLETGGTQNPQAYDAYLRGWQLFISTSDEAGNRAALEEFDRAIALDPNFGAAYGRRAVTLMAIGENAKSVAERDALRGEANSAAERAMKLAPDRADVHTAFWWVRATGYFDFRPAEIDRALALAPGNTRVHQAAALQASWSGHHDLAIKEQRVTIALDPQSLGARGILVLILAHARRFNEALAALADAKAIIPDADIRSRTAYVYLLQGRYDLIQQKKLCEQSPPYTCPAIVKHARGDLSGANEELAALKAKYGDSGAYNYAQIYAQWKHTSLALQWLKTAERVYDPDLVNLKVDPLLDPIRNEPEFKALEERLNFPL
jgi:TolB-like protein/Tfp pilus assembly protein PilF